jgi:hypothetical protein
MDARFQLYDLDLLTSLFNIKQQPHDDVHADHPSVMKTIEWKYPSEHNNEPDKLEDTTIPQPLARLSDISTTTTSTSASTSSASASASSVVSSSYSIPHALVSTSRHLCFKMGLCLYSFLFHTYLGDRVTSIYQYLNKYTFIMFQLPPQHLTNRYNG